MAWDATPIDSIAAALNGGGTSGAINSTGADTIFVSVSRLSSQTVVLTDSKGNTWNLVRAQASAGTTTNCDLYRSDTPAIVGSGHTFTLDTGSFVSLAATAWKTGATVSIDDQQNGNGNSGTTSTPGAITPTVPNCLIITSIETSDGSDPNAIDDGFNIAAGVASTGSNFGAAIAYKVQTTAVAANPIWTGTANSNFQASTIAAFETGAAGPAPFLGNASDKPLPTRRLNPSPLVQSLLQTTLAQVAVATPFFGRTGDVPRPALRSRELLTWTENYVIDDNVPFVQTNWPNPTRDVERRQSWTTRLNTALFGPSVVPFVQTEWPNPVLAVERRQGWSAGYTVLRLPHGTPFAQDDWPNPVLAKRWHEGLYWQDRLTTLLVAPTMPHRQTAWPVTPAAVRGISLAGFAQASAFQMLRDERPFTGLELVNPRGAQFSVDLRGSVHNALTTVPTPPAVTFHAWWAVTSNVGIGGILP